MLLMAVAQSSSSTVTKSQGEGAVLGVFFSIDNELYSIAFGTHIKMAEPVEMLTWMMSGLGPRNSLLRRGVDPQKGNGNFGENLPEKPNTPYICELDWSMQWHTAWLQALDESIIGCEVVSGIAHHVWSLISMIVLLQLLLFVGIILSVKVTYFFTQLTQSVASQICSTSVLNCGFLFTSQVPNSLSVVQDLFTLHCKVDKSFSFSSSVSSFFMSVIKRCSTTAMISYCRFSREFENTWEIVSATRDLVIWRFWQT